MPDTGPVSEQLLATLAELPLFCDYRDGKISHAEYVAGLDANSSELEQRLGGERIMRLVASRYPRDMMAHVLEAFHDLRAQGFVEGEPDGDELRAFWELLRAQYDHRQKRTFIQPNEGGLAYVLSMAKRPKHMVTIGSYYGYWAVWAMPGVEAADGDAALIDPNPEVCALAQRNFATLGYAGRTRVLNAKGEDVIGDLPDGIDFVMLDAAVGRDHPDPAYRGKGIYALFAEMILPKMAGGGLLLAHNDYRPPVGGNPLSKPYIESQAKRLKRFHAFCDAHFRKGVTLDTPDGLGVYLK